MGVDDHLQASGTRRMHSEPAVSSHTPSYAPSYPPPPRPDMQLGQFAATPPPYRPYGLQASPELEPEPVSSPLIPQFHTPHQEFAGNVGMGQLMDMRSAAMERRARSMSSKACCR